MRLVRLLPARWQKFIHEALKFGVVGGINTVINYAVFNALALTVFSDGQLKATVIATIVATITSYLMNRHWTYRDRPKSALRREYALFFLFNATGLLIELGVLALAKYGFGLTSLLALNVAKTGGVLLGTLFRFWSYRTFVFQPAPVVTSSDDPVRETTAGPATTVQSAPDAVVQPAETTTRAGSGGTAPPAQGVAELDPVADLAGSVTELEATEPTVPGTGPRPAPGRLAGPRGAGHLARLRPDYEESTIDAELAAQWEAELQAAARRSTGR
ncbi:GtrA family protein [Micromonospora echinofusca]|uniref:GtrA family protein n=1 Tax=Micromonospora echinofusca TaxID=47858 RepID=A0ABS3VPN4_MICEH|nr:GtrA family protein [Micromonospora echinofusca]MBO4206492.1 GtrA family protein [Micromonospora echinofusca]